MGASRQVRQKVTDVEAMWEHPNIQNVFALLSTTFPKAGMKSEYRRRRGNVHIEHVSAVDDGGAYRLHGVYFILTRSISLVQVIIGGEYGEWWDYRGWVEYCQGLPACAVVPKYITLYNITLHFLHYTTIFPVSLHYIRLDHISLRRPLHCDSFEQTLQVVSNHLQINSAFLSVTNLQEWTLGTGNELKSIE